MTVARTAGQKVRRERASARRTVSGRPATTRRARPSRACGSRRGDHEPEAARATSTEMPTPAGGAAPHRGRASSGRRRRHRAPRRRGPAARPCPARSRRCRTTPAASRGSGRSGAEERASEARAPDQRRRVAGSEWRAAVVGSAGPRHVEWSRALGGSSVTRSGTGQRRGRGDQLAEPIDLDVAARQDDRDAFAGRDTGSVRRGPPPARRRRPARGPASSRSSAEPHAGQDRRVVEQDDVLEVVAGPSPASTPRRTAPRGRRRRCAARSSRSRRAASAERHRVRSLRLHAVDARRGSAAVDRGRDARDQPAAADADDHDVDVRQVLEELEPGRPVPGDRPSGSSNGWTERQPLGVADPLHLGERLADVRRRGGRPARRSRGTPRPSSGRRPPA